MSTPKVKTIRTSSIEVIALIASLFFLVAGMTLISNGKKIYANQLKLSERIR